MAPSAFRRLCGILPSMAVGVEGGGKEKRRFLVSGGWVSITQKRPSTTAMPVPPDRGRASQPAGTSPQLPSSRQKSKTLAYSSKKYHYSALIQCSMHPLSPRRLRWVTGLFRQQARLGIHHHPWLQPAPAMAAACPGHSHTLSLWISEIGERER